MPKDKELIEPQFSHVKKEEIPTWNEGDLQYKLIAGEAFGKKSPVEVFSKLFMIEIKSTSKQEVNIGNHLYGEAGLYILEGSIESEGHSYGKKQLLVANESSLCSFTIKENLPFIYLEESHLLKKDTLIGTLYQQVKNELKKPSKNGKHKLFQKLKVSMSLYLILL